MNAMVCFGESNLAISPITAHHRLIVSIPNPGMERSREARGSRLVASVRSFSTVAMSSHPIDHEVQSLSHFITESFSVGIDQLMQNLLVEGARTNGETPCVERSLDMH